MSDHVSTEENVTGISSQNVEEVSEIQSLTQEAVSEQIRGFIAPLTHQLEELTRLVQGMETTQHPDHYTKTDFGTPSGTATHQSDTYSLSHFVCVFQLLYIARSLMAWSRSKKLSSCSTDFFILSWYFNLYL